jgi:hypothetical protein
MTCCPDCGAWQLDQDPEVDVLDDKAVADLDLLRLTGPTPVDV